MQDGGGGQGMMYAGWWRWAVYDLSSTMPEIDPDTAYVSLGFPYCPACRTTLIATRFRVAVICPIIQVPHCIRVFFYFV